MIFNFELPFSSSKTRIQEAKKPRIRLHIFSIYWYFIPLFVRLRFFVKTSREKFSRKTFAKNWRNFAKTVTPFVKVFVFAKGQKSVFVPTLIGSICIFILDNCYIKMLFVFPCFLLCFITGMLAFSYQYNTFSPSGHWEPAGQVQVPCEQPDQGAAAGSGGRRRRRNSSSHQPSRGAGGGCSSNRWHSNHRYRYHDIRNISAQLLEGCFECKALLTPAYHIFCDLAYLNCQRTGSAAKKWNNCTVNFLVWMHRISDRPDNPAFLYPAGYQIALPDIR
jgi:hypothetical protein